MPGESEPHAGGDVDSPDMRVLRTLACLANRSRMQAATWTNPRVQHP